MSRVFALLVAVALVGGAFYLRDWIEARERDTGEAGTQENGEQVEGGQGEQAGTLALVCATEVADACQRLAAADTGADLEVDVAPAGRTLQQLVAAPDTAEAGLDLWLVPDPWPAMVQILRDPALPDLLGEADVSPVIARTPLVLVAFSERADALRPVCTGEVTWRCLGERAGTPWTDLDLQAPGSVRPGHLDPTRSATGLLVLGQAVSSFFGRSDVSLADLQSDEFSAWFRRLETAVPGFDPASGSQLTEMLTRGLASYDVIGATEAEAASRLSTAAGGPQSLEMLDSEPVASADLVLVALPAAGGPERALEQVGDPLGKALGEMGWRVEGGPVDPVVADRPPLPEDSGLPDAGLLVALQQRWEEVSR